MAPILRVRKRDGTILEDISSIAFDKSATRRLNRIGECSFRVPSYLVSDIQDDGLPLICSGYRQIELSLDTTGLFHHGIAWVVEDEGDADMAYTRVTSYDPMIVWRYRPARDHIASGTPAGYYHSVGDLSDPKVVERQKTGPQIIEEILFQSEASGAGQSPVPSDDAEGQLFLDLQASTFATGGADLSGAPTDYPMSIADLASLLTNTGALDIVIQPLIGGLGQDGFQNIGTVHCYNGNFGTNRTASVHFDWQTGDYNIELFRRSDDMTTIGNKLWYFLGQREDQQHWRGNITADHPDLQQPPGGRVVNPDNSFLGPPCDPLDAAWANNGLGQLIACSRSSLGVFMLLSTIDNFGSGSGGDPTSAYPIWLRQWQIESLLRSKPREMLYITPTKTSPGETRPGDVFLPGDFDIGDLVTVNMGPKSRLTESGGMRIYSYTIDIDDDGVEALGEFQASPDQDQI